MKGGFSGIPKELNRHGHCIVLVVDDEPMVRDIVQHVLLSAGFDVLIAANGSQALELSRRCEGHIDLLLTDVNMPGITGPQLASALAREHPETRIMIMTGGLGDEIPDCLRPDTLLKPFTPRALLQCIATVLGTGCVHEMPEIYNSVTLG
jgi:CheY-like chemotaxis protein